MSNDIKVVNLKFDNETKEKIEILALVRRCNIQSLCLNIIKKELDANADKIARIKRELE